MRIADRRDDDVPEINLVPLIDVLRKLTVSPAAILRLPLGRIAKGAAADLVITDVNMPNMDGISLIRELRALPSYKFTPILTLTTESTTEKKMEGKDAGATGWIVKPVTGTDLIKVIKQLLPGA